MVSSFSGELAIKYADVSYWAPIFPVLIILILYFKIFQAIHSPVWPNGQVSGLG